MKEQEKKIIETEDNKDIEIDLEQVGDMIVGGKLKPLDDRCVIKIYDAEETTDGGIILA